MYRGKLPRIYELQDLSPDSPDAYFRRNVEETLEAWPQKKKQWCDLERELQGLDAQAWTDLKCKIKPLLAVRDAERGWQPLFDRLSEAKAYNYLKAEGYRNIRFIPESQIPGQQTPDLQADNLLCEVKTINISRNEESRRRNADVGTTTVQLEEGFFRKLMSDINNAKQQLDAYCTNAKKVVYIVVNFDDILHEYADMYRRQIEQYIANIQVSELEVVLDIKPPFYATMS